MQILCSDTGHRMSEYFEACMSDVICPYRVQQMLVEVQINDLVIKVRETHILHDGYTTHQAVQQAARPLLMIVIEDADSASATSRSSLPSGLRKQRGRYNPRIGAS
jgi:hypothetical protein